MAIRVQNLPKKSFDERSVHSLSLLSVSCPPWWNSSEQQIAESLPQNISLKVETPFQLYHPAKHLDLQLPDQESISVQAIGQTHHEVGVIGVTNSQCNPSESGRDESCGKENEGQVKPAIFLINNLSTLFSPSHPNYNHSMASARYPYANVYFGGPFTPFGQQAIIEAQLAGSAPSRIPLPLDFAEDEPIYVNAKQYHGILRRRQYRAKLEAQNKLVKSRKPYLHESRHLHALKRVRESGGRFLSKKKPQQPDPASNTSSRPISDISCTDQKNSRAELESHCSCMAEYGGGSSTSCSDVSSVSNNEGNVQQPERGFSDVSPHVVSSVRDGIQHGASVVW